MLIRQGANQNAELSSGNGITFRQSCALYDNLERPDLQPRIRRREVEANTFAAELLMPPQFIEQAVERYGKDIPALAELFDVSRQAMQHRLEKLLLLFETFLRAPG
jgi:Zn-dependent peptidase ImmA (M78 family)